MLTVLAGIRSGASTHTELRVADEAGPFVVLDVRSEGVAEHKTANRVPVAISTVRIQFSSLVALLNIDLSEITNTSDLNVVRSANEMHALKGSVRNDTCASTALSAPCNFFPLCIADISNARRSPQAKISRIIHPHRLAHGALRRRGSTVVNAGLTSLRFIGKLVVHVASVPDLVVVVFCAIATPYLNLVAISHFAVGQIKAFAIGPFDMVVTKFGVIELLVGAAGAVPYL